MSDPASLEPYRHGAPGGSVTPGVAPGCHDIGVILGDANLAACASADATNVFDIGANAFPGASLEDPEFLYTIQEPGVGDLTQGSAGGTPPRSPGTGAVIILGSPPAAPAPNAPSQPWLDASR